MPDINRLFIKKLIYPRLEHIKKVEDELAQRPDQIQPLEDAPVRFNHPERMVQAVIDGKADMKDMMTFGTAPLFIASMLGVLKANKDIEKNPANPRTEITPGEIDELKALAKILKFMTSLLMANQPTQIVYSSTLLQSSKEYIVTIKVCNNAR